MTGGETRTADAVVIVRPPVEVLTRAETLPLTPGKQAALWIALRREMGCLEEVEVKVEGLPDGVKLVEPLTLKDGQDDGLLAAGDGRIGQAVGDVDGGDGRGDGEDAEGECPGRVAESADDRDAIGRKIG